MQCAVVNKSWKDYMTNNGNLLPVTDVIRVVITDVITIHRSLLEM